MTRTRKLLLAAIILLAYPAYAATTKLSQIASGAGVNTSTDQAVAVRSGTTDVLVTLAASAGTDTTNATNISSGTLGTARLPSPFTSGTASGNTTSFGTTSGVLTSGDCVKFDASGNLVDAGAACGSGGGGDTITSPNSTLTVGGTSSNTTLDFNLSNANTWAAVQAFGSGDLIAPNLNPKAASGANAAGTGFTLAGGQGTGTGNGGSAIIQIAPAGLTGSSVNPLLNVYGAVTTSSTNSAYTYGDTTQALTSQLHIFVGGSTATSAMIQFKSSNLGLKSEIINSGAFLYGPSSALAPPAIVMNAGGTDFLTISSLTTSPSTGVLGVAATATTTATPVLSWDEKNHTHYSGTAPAVSACGTTPNGSIDANANDSSGTVTVGGTAASCTITFATAYGTWNHCTVTGETGTIAISYSYSKTAITVTNATLSGDIIDYRCDGL